MTYIRTSTSRGKVYKQLCENRWDPVRKRSVAHVIKQVGKVIIENGKEKLIPSPMRIDSVDKAYPVGKLAVFWKLAEEFKIQKSLIQALGKDNTNHSIALMLLAFNQLLGRKPLTKLGNWISETPIPRWTEINPNTLTKDFFLSALDYGSDRGGDVETSQMYPIQNKLVQSWKTIVGDEPERYYFYQDITKIRWNGSPSFWAQKGYGKQIGRLQIGFGLIVSKDNYMPIMGYPVRGSKPDSTTVQETIDNLNRWGKKGITFVWDRGFVNEKNVNLARDAKYHVLSGIPKTTNESKYWLTKYQDSDIECWKNILPLGKDQAVYFIDEIGELYGNECRIVIMLDPNRRNHSRVERDLVFKALETTTDGRSKNRLKKELKSFVKPTPGRKGYIINQEEESAARKSDGRSLFFCTDKSLSGEEIIHTYFQKDCVEKAFRYMKGNACLSPVQYQLPGRVESYLGIVNFIAYELMAACLWKIRKHKLEVSYEDLMGEAEKIYEVEMTAKKNKIYRWTHMSDDMEKLFSPYGITSLRS